jgi:hypothetical protein
MHPSTRPIDPAVRRRAPPLVRAGRPPGAARVAGALGVLGLLGVLGAIAEPATAAAPASTEPALGRLFHTPGERAALDQGRDRARTLVTRPAAASAPVPPAVLSVDGIVRRDDGQATVWINQRPTRAPADTGSVRIGPVRDAGEAVELRVPDATRGVRLKVGQEAAPGSSEVRDHYRRIPQPVEPGSSPSAPSPPPSPGESGRRTVRDLPAGRDGDSADEAGRTRGRGPPGPVRSAP